MKSNPINRKAVFLKVLQEFNNYYANSLESLEASKEGKAMDAQTVAAHSLCCAYSAMMLDPLVLACDRITREAEVKLKAEKARPPKPLDWFGRHKVTILPGGKK